jgi:predicted transcriptional regulator
MLSVATSITKLRQIRESLGVSQEVLVRHAEGLQLRTYVRIEQGKSAARNETATQILEAVNAILVEQGKPKMELKDLELRLY